MSSAVASTGASFGGGGKTGGGKDKSAAKRLQQELMQLMMSGDKAATAFPTENLFNWVGTIKGSDGTVYEGLEYKLSIQFPADYPYAAPTIKFTTPCFHPNVDNFGVSPLTSRKKGRANGKSSFRGVSGARPSLHLTHLLFLPTSRLDLEEHLP